MAKPEYVWDPIYGSLTKDELEKKRNESFISAMQNDPRYQQNLAQQNELLQKIQMQQNQLTAQAGERPGIAVTTPNKFELKAGVTPPGYEGTRDVRTGKLLEEYTIDPYKSAALKKLQEQGLAEGESPWAKLQMQKQQMEQQGAEGRLGRQAMRGQSEAMGQLARTGGLRGGAAALLARQGQRDLLGQRQELARAGMGQRLGIQEQDIGRKEGILGRLGELDVNAMQANIGRAEGDIGRKAGFDMERYKEQMGAWGAEQTAKATAAAAPGGKCFHPDTLVQMKDGSVKKISEILVGDYVNSGGKVLEVIVSSSMEKFPLYDYLGTKITGSHAVFEGERWVRIEDSKLAKKTEEKIETVYNLVVENHLITTTSDTVFSDNVETDEDYKDERKSLDALNGMWF